MIDWRHWHNEPYLIGGLILFGWGFAIASGPWRGRLGGPTSYPWNHAKRFYGALLIFYLAVGSPLDQIAERFLLSAHMLQHILLIFPAAALFLSGLPAWVVRPVTGQAFLRRPLRIATSPLTCGLLYILVISVWHVPRLYDWALQVKVVHVWEHVMFFAAALAYWWPVLSPSTEFPPCKPGTQMLYQLGIIIGMTPLFAFITFSSDVLYPTYEYAPRLLAGLGPLDDQVLAGVGMKLTGMAVALGVIAVAFYRWFKEDAAAKP